ncbi:hypothetical protein RIF29_40882 [Crotalaria pallida]|uniref:UspA domain-containing protein n=1 Tax=Crotalaria pallida TaxID=3830 RepID=A0AAN9E9E2_CROPI
MATTLEDRGRECLQHDFRRNQVFDIRDEDSEELFEINLKDPLDAIIIEDYESSVFSVDIHSHDDEEKDIVYVAVGHDGESSMEALLWALEHAVTPSSTTLYLIHVFPEFRLIPCPFGKIPRSHVNPEYVNIYLNQEKGKRKVLLQKFLDLCMDSKVKVEMIFVEGDNVSKAIVDLIKNLSIRKLVIGTTKANLRKSVSRRRNDIADKVLKHAPEICDVKIICEGVEVIDKMMGFTTSSHYSSDSSSSSRVSQKDESHAFVPLMRFMPIPIWLFSPRF